VVGLSVGFLVEARNGFGFLVVGFSGFCGGFLFGLGLGFAGWVFWVLPVGFRCTVWWWLTAWAWAWVHGVVVGNGFGFLVVEPWVSAWR
jgi:hypothetical protein